MAGPINANWYISIKVPFRVLVILDSLCLQGLVVKADNSIRVGLANKVTLDQVLALNQTQMETSWLKIILVCTQRIASVTASSTVHHFVLQSAASLSSLVSTYSSSSASRSTSIFSIKCWLEIST